MCGTFLLCTFWFYYNRFYTGTIYKHLLYNKKKMSLTKDSLFETSHLQFVTVNCFAPRDSYAQRLICFLRAQRYTLSMDWKCLYLTFVQPFDTYKQIKKTSYARIKVFQRLCDFIWFFFFSSISLIFKTMKH